MRRFMLSLVTALCLGATIPQAAFAFRWPLDNVQVGGYTFYQYVSGWGYHTGVDLSAPAYTSVYAPSPMVIKFKGIITNGGGCIVAEANICGEVVCYEFMHCFTDATCPWKVGDTVPEGALLTKTAPSYSTYSGPFAAHLHFGVHRGAYLTGLACDATWVYHGYDRNGCDRGNWYDPMIWVNFGRAFVRLGNTGQIGYPVTDFSIPCGCWLREYNGGSFGRCMLVWNGNPDQIYLVRTGFYNKYIQLGATCSRIGPPTSNEYIGMDPYNFSSAARQNFRYGYMIWYLGYAWVYTSGGVRIAAATPAGQEEPPQVPTQLSMAISTNPVHSTTEIQLSLPQAGPVTLEIYDVSGRRIVSLLNGEQPAGEQRLNWNRTTDHGDRVGPGVYFVRLYTPQKTLMQRLAVLD